MFGILSSPARRKSFSSSAVGLGHSPGNKAFPDPFCKLWWFIHHVTAIKYKRAFINWATTAVWQRKGDVPFPFQGCSPNTADSSSNITCKLTWQRKSSLKEIVWNRVTAKRGQQAEEAGEFWSLAQCSAEKGAQAEGAHRNWNYRGLDSFTARDSGSDIKDTLSVLSHLCRASGTISVLQTALSPGWNVQQVFNWSPIPNKHVECGMPGDHRGSFQGCRMELIGSGINNGFEFQAKCSQIAGENRRM